MLVAPGVQWWACDRGGFIDAVDLSTAAVVAPAQPRADGVTRCNWMTPTTLGYDASTGGSVMLEPYTSAPIAAPVMSTHRMPALQDRADRRRERHQRGDAGAAVN